MSEGSSEHEHLVTRSVVARASHSEKILPSHHDKEDEPFQVDNAESIPSHIFRYINHLYQKKKQSSDTVVTPTIPSHRTNSIRHTLDDSFESVKKNNTARTPPIVKKQEESPEDLKKKQEEQELNLKPQVNRYLKKLFKSCEQEIANREQEEADNKRYAAERARREAEKGKFFQTEDDESQSQSLKLNTQPSASKIQPTHTSSQYFSNSIQEAKYSDDSDIEPDDIIKQVTAASTRIVSQLQQLTVQVKKDNEENSVHSHQYELVKSNANFLARQKAYLNYKENKMNLIEKQKQKEKEHLFVPKINEDKLYANKYYTKLQKSITKAQKGQQTDETSFIAEYLSKQRVEKASNEYLSRQKKDKKGKVKKESDSKKMKTPTKNQVSQINDVNDFKESGVQTDWQESIPETSVKMLDYSVHYIPIQDRVEMILDNKQQKIVQELDRRQQEEESFIKSLTFKPKITESVTPEPFSKEKAQLFAKTQLDWKKKLENRALQQKINHLEVETHSYTHRPQILEKSRKMADKKLDRSMATEDRLIQTHMLKEIKIEQKRYNEYPYCPTLSEKTLDIIKKLPPDFSDRQQQGKYTNQRFKMKQEQRINEISKVMVGLT